MHDSPEALDANRCPLCGKLNQCAMQEAQRTGQPQPPCWCVAMTFSQDLLARVPAAAQRRACICRECAQKERPDPAPL